MSLIEDTEKKIMKLKDLTSYLDSVIPLSFQEDYDNAGLQIGQPQKDVTSALVCLDVTEEVITEALAYHCDLIVSHHPLIFKGIKSLTCKTYIERILLEAARNNLAIYSAHTNLDMLSNGVSRKMAEKLGLKEITVLKPL